MKWEIERGARAAANHCVASGVLALLAAASLGCAPTGPEAPPRASLRFPAAVTVDPNGRYAYVLNTNFDSRYSGGTLVAVDLDLGAVLPDSAVETLSYGGRVIGHPDASGGFDRLYFTTREGSALNWATVSAGTTGPAGTAGPKLVCTEDAPEKGTAARCSGKYVFGGVDSTDNAGGDPYSLVLAPGKNGAPDHLVTTAFSGQVGVFRVADDGRPSLLELHSMGPGVYDVDVHPTTGIFYASSKFRNTVAAIDVFDTGSDTDTPFVTVDDAFVVSSSVVGLEFGRDVAFSRDGSLFYLAYRGPPAGVVVVDTQADAAGKARNTILGVAPLPESASGLAVETNAAGEERLYVTLYSRDQVAVVDPHSLSVVDLIDVGDGPFDIAIASSATRGPVAVVTLFREHTLGVIDLDPSSPSYRREVRRIGR